MVLCEGEKVLSFLSAKLCFVLDLRSVDALVGGLGGDETGGERIGEGSLCTLRAGGDAERLWARIDARMPAGGEGDLL